MQELSGDTARKHIEKISREIPFRMAGTEELKQMAEYLRDQMKSYGIAAEVQEFDALVGFTGTAELRVLEPERRIIPVPPLRAHRQHGACRDPGGTDFCGLRGCRRI
jgi:hypothetical protein